MFENASHLWVIHISNHPKVAQRAQREGFISIGWTKIGDVSQIDTREKMKAAMRRAWPDASDATINSSYGQIFRFAHEMQIGDPVVYPVKGSREIMIGEITGPYRWDRELLAYDYSNQIYERSNG